MSAVDARRRAAPGRRSVSLERLLQLSELTAQQVVAIAYDALGALESAGPVPVRLTAEDIHLDERGATRIAPRALARPRSDDDEPGTQAVGRIAFDALRRRPKSPGAQHVEDLAVDLTVHALSIGALGRTPARARDNLGQSLPLLVTNAGLARTRSELGELVHEVHTSAAAARSGPPEIEPSGRAASPVARRTIVAAVVLVAAVAMLATALGAVSASRPRSVSAAPSATAPASAEARPTPAAATAAPELVAPPAPAPLSALPIRALSISAGAGCAAGSACVTRVAVNFAGADGPTALAWSVVFYDGCGEAARTVANAGYRAPRGWNTVVSDSTVEVPGTHRGWLVAVSSSPTRAASEPLAVPGADCSAS